MRRESYVSSGMGNYKVDSNGGQINRWIDRELGIRSLC